ncbi:ammonium transporter [Roseobacter sp. SK209-2-6]|uniref:ammonium transporter n=1 Tax=Roseobacter sp. SK209-2-6 TaxID=388739 RepID=UPI0000F3F519|nr:ammonium transporter [Roseobacter sp. SK209-2-6]EBA14748.1 ammonium transporter [Roseobacter sp. SK209-2-6]
MTDGDASWILIMALFVLVLQCGFLCLEAGTVRIKNATNVALKNISDVCVVSFAFWFLGYGLMFGQSKGGFFGSSYFFPALDNTSGHFAAVFLFQMAFASTTATIVSGAVAERERFLGYMIMSIALGGFIYPIAGHWIWNEGGWLNQMGFIDFAGATVVHSVGGWVALIAVVLLGPRLGRFSHKKRLFEENSISLAALGGLLLWVGWGAFNGGSGLIFSADVAPIMVRTMLTAAGAGLTSIIIGLFLIGHMRSELLINGLLGGLVAGTASIHLISGYSAFVIGAVGAVSVVLSRDILEALKIDDVIGAVPVHLVAGIVGTLAVAFAVPVEHLPMGSRLEQLGVQAIGIACVGLWVFAWALPLALCLKAFGLFRAKPKDEVKGLNLAENHQRNLLLELIEEMKRHQNSSSFARRVRVEHSTEVGALAYRYNKVLDRVELEINQRMDVISRERETRLMAEEAYIAMCEAQQDSAWAARHDRLTGLGNRMHLEEIASDTVEGGMSGALVIAFDLDRFKEVNDTYGHEAGDLVLQESANRICKPLRNGQDFAFRIGGDEFVVLLDSTMPQEEAEELCNDILFELLQPIKFKKTELRVGASIGFSTASPTASLSTALHQADLALYASKRDGRSCVNGYTEEIGAAHEEKLNLIKDFKLAFERNEIEIMLQPQIDAKTRELTGCEALARWNHPIRGILSPDLFTPIAQELNLLAALDRKILDQALYAYWVLAERGILLSNISVNVSAASLASPDLAERLEQRVDLPKNGLAFELLETVFLDQVSDDYARKIQALKDLGITIEIDDFGTGHASIAAVLALQPDRLKIARVFAVDIDQKPERQNLMRGFIEMAASVGAETVIEGIETEAEADVLRDLGADVLQGYVFGRPMDLQAFLAWAETRQVSTGNTKTG